MRAGLYARVSTHDQQTLGLQVEQGGAVFGAVEGIGGGLIDRNGDGLGRWVGVEAAMHRDGFVSHLTHFLIS